MRIFSAIYTTLREITAPPQITPRCVLPTPAPKVKRQPPPKASTVIDLNVQYNTAGKPVSGEFGFHTESKEVDREGAVRYCTEADKQVLRDRGLLGFKKVQAQNENAKALWYAGESVGDAGKSLGLSDSWVEKRFAAFGSALLMERGE